MKDADYYADHPDEFDALPEEDRMRLMVSGFTDTIEEAKEEAKEEEPKAEEPAEEPKVEEPEEPVILAKDGKTTIPYSQLEEERRLRQEERQRAEQWRELAEKLQAAQAKPAEPVVEQKTVRQLRTEARQSLVDGDVDKAAELDEQADNLLIAYAEERAKALVEPIQKNARDMAAKAFEDALRAVHPDYEKLITSGTVEAWIASQPKIVQRAYQDVYENGTAEESIELLNMVKAANKPEPTPDASLAAAAIAKAQAKPPTSLSEVPAGTQVPVDEIEALLQRDSMSMVDYFTGKTPEQVNTILAKLM